MAHKNIIVAIKATKKAVELAHELSIFGMNAVVRPNFSGEISTDVDAVVIDNSTEEMTEVVENALQSFGVCSKIFVITDKKKTEVFEENDILYIPSETSAKFISEIVNFCLNDEHNFDNIIRRMLYDLGFVSNLRGHRYIMDAIKIILDEPKKAYNFQKNVYTPLAEMHNCNLTAIEKSIRNSIEVAYDRDTTGKFKKFFGCISQKPTNAEFLSRCVDKIMMKV